jgi:hypothetical protein
MPTLNNDVTRSWDRGIARVPNRPSRLMAHYLRAVDLVSGARAVLPAVVAFAPLALMVGAAVAASDNRLAAWLSTALVWPHVRAARPLARLNLVARSWDVDGPLAQRAGHLERS